MRAEQDYMRLAAELSPGTTTAEFRKVADALNTLHQNTVPGSRERGAAARIVARTVEALVAGLRRPMSAEEAQAWKAVLRDKIEDPPLGTHCESAIDNAAQHGAPTVGEAGIVDPPPPAP